MVGFLTIGAPVGFGLDLMALTRQRFILKKDIMQEPKRIIKGRIFNHRDGMSELKRFEMENERMTIEERAQLIYEEAEASFETDCRARKQLLGVIIQEITQACAEAVIEATLIERDRMQREWSKADLKYGRVVFDQGFSEAIERAAKIVESLEQTILGRELAKRIRALKPGEIESCRGKSNQVFCNDPNCGNRNEKGFHKALGEK